MSRCSTPFSDAAIDPFLPLFEEDYTQDQLENPFSSTTSDEPVFSAANSDVLDDLDSTFDDISLTPLDSPNPSTPDFSSYNLSRPTSSYPLPGTDSPRPYPLKHTPIFHSRLHPSANPSPPVFDHTYFNEDLLPDHPPNNYYRRRSLSTNDADCLKTSLNPTFVRLQTPRSNSRSRSATAERERERAGPYARLGHGRSRSQTPGRWGREREDRVLGTPINIDDAYRMDMKRRFRENRVIGTPLPREEMEIVGIPVGTPLREDNGMDMGLEVRRMVHPGEVARSRQIIEIGAMAVRSCTPATWDMHELLEEVGRRVRGNEEALRGLEVVRRALKRVDIGEKEGDGSMEMEIVLESGEKPSQKMMVAGQERGLSGGHLDENDLMGMLMRDAGMKGA